MEAHGLFRPKSSQEMLKQTVNKSNIYVPVGVSQVSQRLLRHVISRDYITHEFRVIPKQKLERNVINPRQVAKLK